MVHKQNNCWLALEIINSSSNPNTIIYFMNIIVIVNKILSNFTFKKF